MCSARGDYMMHIALVTVAIQVSGVEGNFRTTCETVMSILRESRDTLVAMLEAFVYDPLVSWKLLGAPNTKPKDARADEPRSHGESNGNEAISGARVDDRPSASRTEITAQPIEFEIGDRSSLQRRIPPVAPVGPLRSASMYSLHPPGPQVQPGPSPTPRLRPANANKFGRSDIPAGGSTAVHEPIIDLAPIKGPVDGQWSAGATDPFWNDNLSKAGPTQSTAAPSLANSGVKNRVTGGKDGYTGGTSAAGATDNASNVSSSSTAKQLAHQDLTTLKPEFAPHRKGAKVYEGGKNISSKESDSADFLVPQVTVSNLAGVAEEGTPGSVMNEIKLSRGKVGLEQLSNGIDMVSSRRPPGESSVPVGARSSVDSTAAGANGIGKVALAAVVPDGNREVIEARVEAIQSRDGVQRESAPLCPTRDNLEPDDVAKDEQVESHVDEKRRKSTAWLTTREPDHVAPQSGDEQLRYVMSPFSPTRRAPSTSIHDAPISVDIAKAPKAGAGPPAGHEALLLVPLPGDRMVPVSPPHTIQRKARSIPPARSARTLPGEEDSDDAVAHDSVRNGPSLSVHEVEESSATFETPIIPPGRSSLLGAESRESTNIEESENVLQNMSSIATEEDLGVQPVTSDRHTAEISRSNPNAVVSVPHEVPSLDFESTKAISAQEPQGIPRREGLSASSEQNHTMSASIHGGRGTDVPLHGPRAHSSPSMPPGQEPLQIASGRDRMGSQDLTGALQGNGSLNPVGHDPRAPTAASRGQYADSEFPLSSPRPEDKPVAIERQACSATSGQGSGDPSASGDEQTTRDGSRQAPLRLESQDVIPLFVERFETSSRVVQDGQGDTISRDEAIVNESRIDGRNIEDVHSMDSTAAQQERVGSRPDVTQSKQRTTRVNLTPSHRNVMRQAPSKEPRSRDDSVTEDSARIPRALGRPPPSVPTLTGMALPPRSPPVTTSWKTHPIPIGCRVRPRTSSVLGNSDEETKGEGPVHQETKLVSERGDSKGGDLGPCHRAPQPSRKSVVASPPIDIPSKKTPPITIPAGVWAGATMNSGVEESKGGGTGVGGGADDFDRGDEEVRNNAT